MFNYISNYNNEVLIINNNDLIKFKNKEIKKIQHNSKLTYVEGNIITDEKKNLYEIKDKLIPKVKIEKSISKMCFYNHNLYFADRFGDVYELDASNNKKLLLGNMCCNSGICIINNIIITSDKYGRLRISDLEGRIKEYVFLNDKPIISICIFNGIAVATKNKITFFDENYKIKNVVEVKNVRKLLKIDEERILVLADESVIMNKKEEISQFEFSYDATVVDGLIYYINKNKELILNGEIIVSLEDDYENHLNILN